MKIGIDMMGGDFAPLEAVKGIQQYREDGSAHLVLVGDEEKISRVLADHPLPESSFTIVHAPQVIGMHEHPTRALKEKQQSSIAIGFHLLSTGKTDAFISAGNTGAMLVGSLYSLKTLEGVLRPTISTIIPKENGHTGLLLDVGLNSDCKPEHLNQFAIMGSVYARNILGIENPRVALLNIGEEEGKGNLLAQATYPLLKENTQINFIGNIEGWDMFRNKAEVIVCEGFTGNVALKMAESLYHIFKERGIQDDFLDHFNFEIYGGTPILGINSPVMIGHGISHAMAFKNMIDVASKIVKADLISAFKTRFAEAVA